MAEIDINKIKASVASITPANADANVRLEATDNGPEFVFSFKLPAGADGKDGTNVIGVSLTDENVWVPCLDDGTPDPDLGSEHASTQILLKNGDEVITKGVSYKITAPDTPGNFSVDEYGDVTVTLEKDSAEVINIVCTAIYNRTEHNRTFSIKKAIGAPVYKVVPDVSAIKQDNAIKIPSILRVDVLKWNGKSWGLTSELPVMYNYSLMDGTEEKGLLANKYYQDEDTVQYTIDVENYNNLKTLEVYIEKDGIKLDYQSVSIVKDGIGMITAHAYTTVSSDLDLSNYTVTGGSYWTINDVNTYDTFITKDSEGNLMPIIWTPTNSNQRNDAQVTWMISQVFASTDDVDAVQTWSYPIVLQDSDHFQVEYSANDVETPPTPISFGSIITSLVGDGVDRSELTTEVLEAKWREVEANKTDENGNPWIWSDTITNPKWMATCRLQNGEWSKWTVTKCRGEIGYNAQQIELSNESEYVPCVNVGDSTQSIWIPDPDLFIGENDEKLPIASTEILLMDGHKNITQNCKIKIECSDNKIESWTENAVFTEHVSQDGFWELKEKQISDDTKIGVLNVYNINEDVTHFTITLTYVNERHGREIEYKGTFKIIKVKNAITYKISPNVNAIKIDSEGNAHPDYLEVSLLKWNGQRWENIKISEENTYGLDWDCSGTSNVTQSESNVNKDDLKNTNGESPVSYNDGKLIIQLEQDEYYPKGYPGQFSFTIPITSDDGVEIGKEKESIPVMSDGINIKGLFEYYITSEENTAPSFGGEGFPDVNDTEKWDNNKLATDLGNWKYNTPPTLDATNKYLWNVEVVVNSWGDIVTVTKPALVGTYGIDGMTPYEILEFYDVSANSPEKGFDELNQFKYSEKGSFTEPSTEYPYVYGFERVLYSIDPDKYTFNKNEGVFYNATDKTCIESPTFTGTDSTYVNSKFIKYVDAPVSLISKIGAGSFTEQLYKWFAQGTTTLDEPSSNALATPGDKGSYSHPAPTQDELSAWNYWTDGISSEVYDFNGNKIEKYKQKEHGGKVLYMTLRVFTTDGKSPQDASWRTPTIASDVEGKIDIEWSSQEDQPLDPSKADEGVWSNEVSENAIWMAIRYMGSNGVWGEWQISKIKGEKGNKGDKGESGSSSFTSIVFTRSVSIPDKPTGGSYDDPVPKGWSDGIPDGDTSIPIWSSRRKFGKNGESDDESWTDPKLMADTADFDVEYSSVETSPGNPTDNSGNWTNDASTSAIWMATRSMKNGSWTGWTITRIKGEKGDTGTFSEEDEKRLTEAILKTAGNNLADAKTDLQTKIANSEKALNEALAAEKTARESGDEEALLNAQNALAEASAAVERLNTVKESIENLNGKFDPDTGKIKDTVLDENEIYDLSIAALGKDASELPEGSVKADSYFGRYFAGTVGLFGDLIADNITTTKIQGKLKESGLQELSIYSGTTYDDSSWALDKSGKGKIAKGNISWTEDGIVTFSDDVELKWTNLSDGDTKFNEKFDTRFNTKDVITSTILNNKGFATTASLKDYLKNSDLNSNIQLYLETNTNEVSDIIGDSVLSKLDKEKLTTKLGNHYIATGTTFTNTLFAGDIYGKTIKNDSSGSKWSINEDGSGKLASGNIEWKSDGTCTFNGSLILNSTNDYIGNININANKGFIQESSVGMQVQIGGGCYGGLRVWDGGDNGSCRYYTTQIYANEEVSSESEKFGALATEGAILMSSNGVTSGNWYISGDKTGLNIYNKGQRVYNIVGLACSNKDHDVTYSGLKPGNAVLALIINTTGSDTITINGVNNAGNTISGSKTQSAPYAWIVYNNGTSLEWIGQNS